MPLTVIWVVRLCVDVISKSLWNRCNSWTDYFCIGEGEVLNLKVKMTAYSRQFASCASFFATFDIHVSSVYRTQSIGSHYNLAVKSFMTNVGAKTSLSTTINPLFVDLAFEIISPNQIWHACFRPSPLWSVLYTFFFIIKSQYSSTLSPCREFSPDFFLPHFIPTQLKIPY